MILSLISFTNLSAQDNLNPQISTNMPLPGEYKPQITDKRDLSRILELEKKHKRALENGNISEANIIESEINALIPAEMKYNMDNSVSNELSVEQPESEGDWNAISQTLHSGHVNKNPYDGNQIDIKRGEDGILYAAVNVTAADYALADGKISLYQSTNDGSNWYHVVSHYYNNYIESLKLIVESKSNAIGDSTRLIVFFIQNENNNYDNSFLSFFSVLKNGSRLLTDTIAVPGAGNTFTGLSTVSDGAFYQNATYFGVVCNEVDNVTGNVENIRYFRTINWGVSWVGTSFVTSFNDRFPSSDYKEGSSDSIYIAVERVLTTSESQIRIIATPFSPSAGFSIKFLTSTSGVKYEKPCLTIKQTNPAQEILITSTKNKNALYHFTENVSTWSIDNPLSLSTAQNEVVTFCSSNNTGTKNFSAGWVSVTGDSLFMSKGDLGDFLSAYTIKTNNTFVSKYVTPVCVNIPHTPEPNSGVIYSTYLITQDSVRNVYFNREGSKYINITAIPQGFYNPVTNKLNYRDTLRIYFRSYSAPNTIIDSGIAVIDSNTMTANFGFSWLSDGKYYIQLKHRNSLETWSQFIVLGGSSYDYNFTDNGIKAYGSNMIQVDTSPLKFAIYCGDANQDGTIDASDLSLIENASNSFLTGYQVTDINGDGIVDGTDASLTDNNAANFVSKITP